MTLKPLSTSSLLDLFDIFENSFQAVADAQGQRLDGVPGWDFKRTRAISGAEFSAWSECIGYAGYYPAACGDRYELVDVEEADDPGKYRYRCPETFRLKEISAAEVAVHSVITHDLLHYLGDLLQIPQALRHGIGKAAIDGTLWQLGKTRIGKLHVDIWLVRGLATQIEVLFRHLRDPFLADTGIVFSTGRALPALIQPPRNYHVIPLGKVLSPQSASPVVDRDLLQRLMSGLPEEKPGQSAAVWFDDFTQTLHISTKAIAPWVIKGAKQAAVVKCLVEQFAKGRDRVSAGDLLLAAYGARAAASGKRVAKIFSGNDKWRDYIVFDEAGYGLKFE